MTGTIFQVLTYLSLLIFIIAVVYRFIRIATAPAHLRWELYPVPHEKGRASYGGSRLEEVDWWTKKQEKDHLGELKVMIPEIVFLKAVWEHNKALWSGTFPFHFALYMMIFNVVLIKIAAWIVLLWPQTIVNENPVLFVIVTAIYAIAWVGSIIGIIGSIRMFFLRIADSGLAKFSSPSHFFNIILIGAIYASLLVWLIVDENYVVNSIAYFKAMITFGAMQVTSSMPVWGYIHIAITLFFLVYLPFTHMTHFFTKYFTYHKIRWEDAPNDDPNSKMGRKLAEQLNYNVSWAAPHIGSDGKKNWIAVASDNAPKGEQK
jgi:nitrate reductase gamma subunit